MESTVHRFAGSTIELIADRWQPDQGSARGTVLLLHGGGQTRHSWKRTGTRLSEHGWETFSIDARGHGESQWAPDGDYTIAAHARDVRSCIAELDTQPILVGASLGGMAAMTALAEAPDIAKALVLVDITPRAEEKGLTKIENFMRSGLDGFDTLEEAHAAVVAYNPHRKQPPRLEGLRRNLRERDGRWYWHWDPQIMETRENRPQLAADREDRARAAAARITVPTLLIRGSQSDIVNDDGVADLLELIPHARFIDVAGAGHMVSGDDNDVLSTGLISFLDEVG